ncbi:hypothetical protein TELCIR_12438 [Teladorsagia circumcincta]|uniref:Uncharacterized protein n=1 Tax=Teladorsagia circumcincta TaxID=45464 RepID=A0A2G9U6H7_TELCI|nr:hypothetical protein TELCIR_12438 [Teladorsagia circumcincta]
MPSRRVSFGMNRVADYDSPPPEKRSKINSCREAMFGERARKWAFFFIVAFLACLTIKDVVDLEALANMTDHDSFLSKMWDYRLVMEAYDMIATYNSLERESHAHGSARAINMYRASPRFAGKRAMFKKWAAVLDSRNVTFEEFTQKAGTEVLRRSMQRFLRTTFDEDLVIKTKLRISWISQMQICFQPLFDEDNYYAIEDQGNFFTMLLSHNAENLDGEHLECMSVDFHGRPSSLNRFMEGKGRARDGFTFELCAGQRHEVTVEVRALYQMLENDDPGTACRDVEEGEDSEFDCRSRCRMKMIRNVLKDATATVVKFDTKSTMRFKEEWSDLVSSVSAGPTKKISIGANPFENPFVAPSPTPGYELNVSTKSLIPSFT